VVWISVGSSPVVLVTCWSGAEMYHVMNHVESEKWFVGVVCAGTFYYLIPYITVHPVFYLPAGRVAVI
jgi:hypothetical protein